MAPFNKLSYYSSRERLVNHEKIAATGSRIFVVCVLMDNLEMILFASSKFLVPSHQATCIDSFQFSLNQLFPFPLQFLNNIKLPKSELLEHVQRKPIDKASDLFVAEFRIFHHLINKHPLQLCLEGELKCPCRCSFQNFLSHSPKLQIAKVFDDRRL